MKKLCYLLCMICALSAFHACSDDDDDTNASIPVTAVVVPPHVRAGSELIIAGNGFAANCKILLKNDTQSVELTVSERLSASVSCTVPTTLAPGEYTVVLVQDGEWLLRKITVLEEGAADPDVPVSALLFPPDPVSAGEEATIQGLGFAKNCELSLKLGEETLKMEIAVSDKDVTFTLPATLAAGTYTVILKQDGGEWVIGKITVEAKAVTQKTQIDKITQTYTKKGKEQVIVNSYTYNADGKLSSVETIHNGEKDSRVDFTWTSGQLTVNFYAYDSNAGDYYEEEDMYCVYTLTDGKVAHSEYSGFMGNWESDWTYRDGYLSDISGIIYTMDGDRLSGFSDGYGMDLKFTYENNQANKSVIDLMGEVSLYCGKFESEEQYYARLAGICGKAPGLLPSSIIQAGDPDDPDFQDETIGITYETDADGYVTKLIFADEDGDKTFEVTYK